jgi:hypothetical protein
MMVGERRIGKNLEGSGRGLIEILSRNLPGQTQESRGKSHDSRSPGEIRIEHLHNTITERSRYTNPPLSKLFYFIAATIFILLFYFIFILYIVSLLPSFRFTLFLSTSEAHSRVTRSHIL